MKYDVQKYKFFEMKLIAVTILIHPFITIVPIASYVGAELLVATLIALLVCLIPTTIGGLLSAIGIAGMDRVTKFNVIAKSGKAVEAAGDINTIILDKTGTITHGNRMASSFIPVKNSSQEELNRVVLHSSLHDETPEGSSVIELAKNLGVPESEFKTTGSEGVEFRAETRMSGTDFADGRKVRKGAVDAIKEYPWNMAVLFRSIWRKKRNKLQWKAVLRLP